MQNGQAYRLKNGATICDLSFVRVFRVVRGEKSGSFIASFALLRNFWRVDG
jgi:hypothetical protein